MAASWNHRCLMIHASISLRASFPRPELFSSTFRYWQPAAVHSQRECRSASPRQLFLRRVPVFFLDKAAILHSLAAKIESD